MRMWRTVQRREIGESSPQSSSNFIRAQRARSLTLANRKEIRSAHKSAVNTLQIDTSEARYLLAGASDGSVAAYDIQQFSYYDRLLSTSRHEALFLVDKRIEQGHRHKVSSVCWYPIDTGLFITGSFDHYVKVWDTNTTEVVLEFKMPGKVYAVGMSAIASTHMLIATGTEDNRVRLCDIATGAFTHTLPGHRDGVWAVQWSSSNQWLLFTGGGDGAIRFWDIRRAGCFRVLDQHNSQIGRRPPVVTGKLASASHIRSLQKARQQSLHSDQLNRLNNSTALDWKSQRQHHSISTKTHEHATAHYGTVTGLQTTPDGFYLLSAGTDSRVRLWDVESGCNTLVNYPATRIRRNWGTQIAVSSDSSLVFIPSANIIQAFDIWTGHLHSTLKGHYDVVNCCTFHPQYQELYSGSNDRQILIWVPPVFLDLMKMLGVIRMKRGQHGQYPLDNEGSFVKAGAGGMGLPQVFGGFFPFQQSQLLIFMCTTEIIDQWF